MTTQPTGDLTAAIAAMEAQRGVLGDKVVDLAVRVLRERLVALEAQAAPAEPEADLTRGTAGIQIRMIGRGPELRAIQDAFFEVEASGLRREITISGEAGVGKSRLIAEFEAWLAARPAGACPMRCFRARAGQDTQSAPFGLLRALLAQHFGIQSSDGPETARARLEQGLVDVLNRAAVEASSKDLAEASNKATATGEAAPASSQAVDPRFKAQVIGHLLGFDFRDSPALKSLLHDSRQLRDRAANYLNEFFGAAASDALLLVLLEDLHWADDSSLDLLESLGQMGAQQRILLISAARPVLFERRPGWGQVGAPHARHARLALQALSSSDSRRLAEEILQRAERRPAPVLDLLVQSAGGNPYYMEELARMLVEDDVIRIEESGAWRVALDRLAVVRIPATLEGVLQARIDSLPVLERAVLQRAAVIGLVFWDKALAYLDPNPSPEGEADRRLEQALDGLVTREMIQPILASGFGDAREYIFRQNLLREVAYLDLLKRERRVYHARAAEWLERRAGGAQNAHPQAAALVAEHYDQAGDGSAAAIWYRIAGMQAAARFGNVEAVRCLSRALALTPADSLSLRYDLLRARESILDLQAERRSQVQDLETMETLALALQDPLLQAEAALRQANYGLVMSDYNRAIRAAQKAVHLSACPAPGPGTDPTPALSASESARAQELEARAILAWGRACWNLGQEAESSEKFRSALERARASESGALASVEAEALRNLGVIYADQGNFTAAQEAFDQSLRIYRALGDRQGEAYSLSGTGNLAIDMGDHAAAHQNHEQALRIRMEIGDRRGAARALGSLGFVASEQGDYSASKAYYEQARAVFRQIGDRQGESIALINQGNDAMAQGDYTGALACQQQALALKRELGDLQGEAIALDNLSLIYHYLGQDGTAVESSQAALVILEGQGLRHLQGYAFTHLGRGLHGLGRLEDARQAYQRGLDLRLELGEAALAAESRAGLARVALAQENQVAALSQVLEILAFLKTGSTDGMVDPFLMYLTCYQVLHETGDSRARDVLVAGYHALQARAARIMDLDMRELFLTNVASNRELAQAYEEMAGGQGRGTTWPLGDPSGRSGAASDA